MTSNCSSRRYAKWNDVVAQIGPDRHMSDDVLYRMIDIDTDYTAAFYCFIIDYAKDQLYRLNSYFVDDLYTS